VGEFFGQTQITAGSISVTGTDALPTATAVDLGATGAILDASGNYVVNLEAVEGMLITIPEDLTISEMFNLDRFGEYRVSSEGRPFQFTQQNAPDVAGYDAHLQDVAARSLVLDDGSTEQNPFAIEVLDGNNGVLDANDSFRMGDTLTGVTGVVAYSFNEFRINDATGDYTETNQRPETPDAVGGDFKVASFNVLNFFTTLDTNPGGFNGPNNSGPDDTLEPRGANSELELERQTTKLVNAIVEMDADVLGLVEIENDDDEAISALVDAVNAALGSEVYDFIPTGDAGSDAITNGLIYKTATATPVGDVAVLTEFNGQSFLDPLNSGGDLNRPAVTQTFEDVSSGAQVTVSVNHFKSKGSLSGLSADEDQGDGAGNNNATREAASVLLADWLASDPTGTGAENQLIIGDLNSYAEETPITTLEAAGFTDVAQAILGPDAYGYVFDGQIGTLDYILANGPAFEALEGATEWHINADEADAIDYNIDIVSGVTRDPAIFNGDTAARNSDHDPVIAGFTFEEEELILAEFPDVRNRRAIEEDDVNGVAPQDFLSGAQSSSFEVQMVKLPGASAGFRNSVGVYEVDEAGNIVDVDILFENAKPAAARRDTAIVDNVEAGHDLGFFLVQNAFNTIRRLDDDVEFSFLDGDGNLANIDDGADIFLAFDGVASDLTVFHSFDASLNVDGIEHVISALNAEAGEMRIGFEDLTGGGDRDFEDVIFDVRDTGFDFV
jgi:predicted extracellular nuclease